MTEAADVTYLPERQDRPVVAKHRRVGLPAEDEASRMYRLAKQAAGTDMVPSDMRGDPYTVLSCAIAGRELGLGFFESLRSFYVVDGKPTESAELLHTLALRAGHDLWVSEASHEEVTVTYRHRDWPEDRQRTLTWTLEDAAIANLVDWDCIDEWPGHHRNCNCKDNWRKYPRAMLRSRVVTEAVRSAFPEVTVGATYTPEELGASVEGPGGVPEDAAEGFGASGTDFEIPDLEMFDAAWIAMHNVDQVLAVVDHYGPDTELETGHTLASWARECEDHEGRRPRLLEALDTRMDVVDAEVVDEGDHQEPADEDDEPSRHERLLANLEELIDGYPDEFLEGRDLAALRDHADYSEDHARSALRQLREAYDEWAAEQAVPVDNSTEDDGDESDGEDDGGESLKDRAYRKAEEGAPPRQTIRSRLRAASVSGQQLSAWLEVEYDTPHLREVDDDEVLLILGQTADGDGLKALVEEIRDVVREGDGDG